MGTRELCFSLAHNGTRHETRILEKGSWSLQTMKYQHIRISRSFRFLFFSMSTTLFQFPCTHLSSHSTRFQRLHFAQSNSGNQPMKSSADQSNEKEYQSIGYQSSPLKFTDELSFTDEMVSWSSFYECAPTLVSPQYQPDQTPPDCRPLNKISHFRLIKFFVIGLEAL